MTPFAARCVLVGAAVAATVAGVVAPLPGPSRAVLLVAATCCAVIDVLLVRATRAEAARPTDAAAVTTIGPVAVVPGPSDDAGPPARPTIVLGSTDEGRTIAVEGRGPTHIAVVGTGVLAAAVFRAVAAQVRTAAAASGTPIRVASAPELRTLLANPDEPCPPMSDGTAAVVGDVGARAPTTAVLVPGPGQVPRAWDLLVEVTRYGCTVRRRDETTGVPVSPVLPELDP
ncbi:hypothetical protein SAMN05660766_0232 [Curtobacterium sp. 314Chir4.1]|uniref:hypothetical protein n=1 Tax=Curtobacterium sp. 314Chir4.1 TaxID=1279028 RepID=UPI000BDD059C|nr:hypothetical protein [Curtobacterium sp. 314Chir4.1]SOC86580.1 hypothetical protein SAMN05660766_0232 [Curtobacterium sp. 314Chir4.1]